MRERTALKELYRRFDRVFPRPESFHNLECCVSKAGERELLKTDRANLQESELGWAFNHYPGGQAEGCFGTFPQMAHFVPRMLELHAHSEAGFVYALGFWSRLVRDRGNYEDLGLWETVYAAVLEQFQTRTERFEVEHFDLAACRAKSWALDHQDIVRGSEAVRDLLAEFFQPLTEGSEAYEELFETLARDSNPHRLAYLLETLRESWSDELNGCSRGALVPRGFEARMLEGPAFIDLVERALPAISACGSPTWFTDLREAYRWMADRERRGWRNAQR